MSQDRINHQKASSEGVTDTGADHRTISSKLVIPGSILTLL